MPVRSHYPLTIQLIVSKILFKFIVSQICRDCEWDSNGDGPIYPSDCFNSVW